MTAPCRIDPEAFYNADQLRRTLGVRYGSLDRARRSGELRSTRKGGRTLYLGQWVLDWLTRDAAPEQREAESCA